MISREHATNLRYINSKLKELFYELSVAKCIYREESDSLTLLIALGVTVMKLLLVGSCLLRKETVIGTQRLRILKFRNSKRGRGSKQFADCGYTILSTQKGFEGGFNKVLSRGRLGGFL
jgi:hypothetical protein